MIGNADGSAWVPLRPGEGFVPQLLAASRTGRGLACADADVDAAELRAACLATGEADPFGLRMSGARVTGRLDLRACEVRVPLRFQSCTFTDPVSVQGAALHDLVFTADPAAARPSVLPGLSATGARFTRDLILSGMVITGDIRARDEKRTAATVWLAEAEVGGSIVALGTRIRPGSGRAVHADRMRVAGNIRLLDGFRSTGEVRLRAVRLTGSLDLIGAELAPSHGWALDLAGAAVGGHIRLLASDTGRRCRVRGRIEMAHATVDGDLVVEQADLTAPPAGPGAVRTALWAPQAVLNGALRVDGDTVVRGGLLLPGARLGGGVALAGAVWNPRDTALDLTQATIGGGVDGSGLSVEGTVRFDSARIDGPMHLEHATLTAPLDRKCLSAVNLTVDGDVQLSHLAAVAGRLDFRGAVITGVFNAEAAYITNPGDKTVNLNMAQITGNVRLCGGFRSAGLLVLDRAVVGGRLRADGAVLTWAPAPAPLDPPGEANARGAAVEAISAVFRGGIDLGWRIASGAVDFTGATTSYLADRPDQDWPADSYLGGFAYDRFEAIEWHGDGVWDAATRIAWLARMRRYDSRAWERLASVLRTAGDRDGADAVLIAQRRRARPLRSAPRRVLDVLQDVTVRYGFRPQRALYLLLTLIAMLTVALSLPAVQADMRATDQNALVFAPSGARPLPGEATPPGTCGDGKVRCLNPFFYAVDTVVPLIDLHQRSTWYPGRGGHGVPMEWVLNLCTILGWLASTVFAVSFTRLGRAG